VEGVIGMLPRSPRWSRPLGHWLSAAFVLTLAGCAPASPSASVEDNAVESASLSAGASAPASAAPVSAGTVTLDSNSCIFVGSGAASDATGFTIEVVNTTPEASGFDLYRLHDDTAYADWVAYNAAAQDSFEQGGEGPGDPLSIADPIDVQVAVGAGASGTMHAVAGNAGSYALQCWIFPAVGVGSLFSAGPVVIE